MNITNPKAIGEYSIADFQKLNLAIFLIQNDRHFCYTPLLVSRLNRQAIQLQWEIANANRPDFLSYRLAMAFSWLMALANRLHIILGDEIGKDFEGDLISHTLVEFQNLLGGRYVIGTPEEEAQFLIKEIATVDEAIESFITTHDTHFFVELKTSVASVVRRMCSVASSLDFDLACEMEKHFGEGCPKCHHVPCDCPFSVAKMF